MTMSLIFLLLKTSPNNEAIIDSARSVNRLFMKQDIEKQEELVKNEQRFDKKKKQGKNGD